MVSHHCTCNGQPSLLYVMVSHHCTCNGQPSLLYVPMLVYCFWLFLHHHYHSSPPLSYVSNIMNMTTVRIDWSVKGYHHFKIRPHPEVDMIIQPEEGNPYDPFAVKVVMPTLTDIPRHLHHAITRPGSRHSPVPQTVARIAGKQVGRVPANLCRAFRAILERGLAVGLVCKYNDFVGQSRDPTPMQRFERRYDANFATPVRDLPGGGAELKCSYHIRVSQQNFEQTMHILEEHVGIEELDNRIFA